MNDEQIDEQIIKTCEDIIVSYFKQQHSAASFAVVFNIQSDKTHKRLKQHMQGIMALFEKGLAIIESEENNEIRFKRL